MEDKFVDVRGLNLILSPTGEVEQLLGHVGPLLDEVFHTVQPFVIGMRGRHVKEGERDVALDPHEDIVEIVRNTTR